MNKVINIKSNAAKREIAVFKKRHYYSCDIKFENMHLCILNKMVRHNIFKKNDIYINSTTLYEIMQPVGSSGLHNYHGLTVEDVFDSLNAITTPQCILKSKNNRFIIVPTYCSSYDLPLMVVIEIGASLVSNQKANINKIVTIYPKSDLDEYIKKIGNNRILYIKKMSTNTGLQLP